MSYCPEPEKRWVQKIGNDLTLYGAYIEFYSEIAAGWNSDTRHEYNNIMNRIILPNLKDHNKTPIKNYELEDYLSTLDIIEKNAKIVMRNNDPNFAKSSVSKYEGLLRTIVNIASTHACCRDVLSRRKDYQHHRTAAAQVFIPKALTAAQTIAVFRYVHADYLQSGTLTGLALMYDLGLRNGESCGANFNDIECWEYNGEIWYMLRVDEVTLSRTNTPLASGKTRNANRRLYIPDHLYHFLMARLDYLRDHLDFTGRDDYHCAEDLPIVCVGNDYFRRASADDLTWEGRQMFSKIGMGEQLFLVGEELEAEQKEVQLDSILEKDPTTYLLRRDYATRLVKHNLLDSELDFTIGHEIRDPGESRNAFNTSAEKLYRIKKKLEVNPLFTVTKANCVEIPLNSSISLPENDDKTYVLPLGARVSKCFVRTYEPTDTIDITISSTPDAPTVTVEVSTFSQQSSYTPVRKYRPSVNNLKEYRKAFSRRNYHSSTTFE